MSNAAAIVVVRSPKPRSTFSSTPLHHSHPLLVTAHAQRTFCGRDLGHFQNVLETFNRSTPRRPFALANEKHTHEETSRQDGRESCTHWQRRRRCTLGSLATPVTTQPVPTLTPQLLLSLSPSLPPHLLAVVEETSQCPCITTVLLSYAIEPDSAASHNFLHAHMRGGLGKQVGVIRKCSGTTPYN